MQLEGKAAIVTGGGTGVGRATALQLAGRGCSIVVNYCRSKEMAEQTAHDVAAFGVGAIAVRCDVADDASCRAMIDVAVGEFGRLDVLVQCAATTTFIAQYDLDAVTDEHWDRILSVNLKGAFQCARAVKRPMERSGGGAIVNVSSIAGARGIGSSIPYTTSKAALNSLTITLARAFAPKIRVNAIAPGFVTGRWLEQGLGSQYERIKHMVETKTPLGAVCSPADVATAIMSLITGSDLVTGQVLAVDGGIMIAS